VTPTDSLPYRLVVPAAWTRLPMDPVGMRDTSRAMLLRRFGALPRDQTATLRREVEQDLVALTRRAGSEYARMLLVLALEVSRRPITASCLVSLLPQAVPDETALQALAVDLSDGAATSVVEDLGANRGVVVVRDEVMPMSSVPEGVDVEALAQRYAEAIGSDESPATTRTVGAVAPWTPGTTRHVDVHLPVPDVPRLLLLSFSTPLVPLFEPLTELFLMMAATVQWDRGDGSWS
jgi:hypothetical protein